MVNTNFYSFKSDWDLQLELREFAKAQDVLADAYAQEGNESLYRHHTALRDVLNAAADRL